MISDIIAMMISLFVSLFVGFVVATHAVWFSNVFGVTSVPSVVTVQKM